MPPASKKVSLTRQILPTNKTAVAGQTVTYTLTITNSGVLADSFDLIATDPTWATILSTSMVELAATASADFIVTVTIPVGAGSQENDTVTITAASQGDSSKTDSAVLTTTSSGQPARVYLPIVISNPAIYDRQNEDVIYACP